ncbi:MAG: MFS transporter [Anaerovoracaceae bacterium]
MRKILNVEYATIHGAYWMYYGVICSFASVFLLAKDYSNSSIGLILAVGNIVAVILQPLIADFADRAQKISLIGITQLIGVLLIVLTAVMFFFEQKSIALSVVFVLLVGWLTVVQPLINTLNFKLEESGIHINFGVARSLGSLAYSVLCAFLGTIVENFGVIAIPISGEIVLAMLLISLWLTNKHYKKACALASDGSCKINKDKEETIETTEEIITLIDFVKKNKVFIVVSLGIVGLFFSNAILNNFMMQIVSNVGGDSGDMGRIFSVMAALEIPTMVLFDNIRRKFSCKFLLKVASVGFVAKIGLCFLAKSVITLFIAQGMQLFSFALFLPAMVHFIDEAMEKGEAVKGQALFIIMITVSTVFASFIGGIILDASGAKMLLLVSTLVTAIGAVVIVGAIDKVKMK